MNNQVSEVDTRDVREVLEQLIAVARDGQEGYRLAASHAHHPALKQAFSERCRRRERFVSQLQSLQVRYGQKVPDTSGSFKGTLHRAWMNIRPIVDGAQEDQAILEEAERGEDVALQVYEDALQHDPALPADAARCVLNQAGEVREDHDYMRKLCDSGRFAEAAPD